MFYSSQSLLCEGFSDACQTWTIRDLKRKHSIRKQTKQWPESDYWDIQRYFEDGLSVRDVMQKMGNCGRSIIATVKKDHGVQDLAKPHMPRESMDYINDAEWIPGLINNWPPKGADIPPIELVWAEMTRRMNEDPAETVQELRDSIMRAWKLVAYDNELTNCTIIHECANFAKKSLPRAVVGSGR
eukprot:gene19116-923_t